MTDALPFSEADRREYMVREAQLKRLESLVEHIHDHAVNVKVSVACNWDSLLIEEDDENNPIFKLTTGTEMPVMYGGKDVGREMNGNYTFDQAECFIGGLTFGLMFGGNWHE